MNSSNQAFRDKNRDSGADILPAGGCAQIDLAGAWGFKPGVFDPADNTAFPETVRLPGSLAENGIGNGPAKTETVCFSPTHIYNGPGVFRHELQIPDSWADKVIDNPFRHHRLALLFEARVGRGKLLVCTIALPALVKEERPEARRLMAGLFAYAASPAFNPECRLEWQTLTELLYGPLAPDPVPDNPFAYIFG